MATTVVRRFGLGVLCALALVACGSSGGGTAADEPSSTSGTQAEASATTISPRSEPSTSSELAPEDDLTQLQFRPVLEISFPANESTTTVANGIVVPTADDGPIYNLGPIGFDGTALTDAKAVLNETWVVEVRVADDAVRAANEAFNECYDAEPTCPGLTDSGRGAIAIVLEGEVVSAPQVNGKDLASDAFVISGDFDQAEAERIADLING